MKRHKINNPVSKRRKGTMSGYSWHRNSRKGRVKARR